VIYKEKRACVFGQGKRLRDNRGRKGNSGGNNPVNSQEEDGGGDFVKTQKVEKKKGVNCPDEEKSAS